MANKPKCKDCGADLVFRAWSDRLPAKSEALAECSECGAKWQIRYGEGKPTSSPYRVRGRAEKTKRGSYLLPPIREAAIKAMYGSVQEFLDRAPLVCMSLQSKS